MSKIDRQNTHLPARLDRSWTALASPLQTTIMVVCVRGCLLLKKISLLSPLSFLYSSAVLGSGAAVSALRGRIDVIMGYRWLQKSIAFDGSEYTVARSRCGDAQHDSRAGSALKIARADLVAFSLRVLSLWLIIVGLRGVVVDGAPASRGIEVSVA